MKGRGVYLIWRVSLESMKKMCCILVKSAIYQLLSSSLKILNRMAKEGSVIRTHLCSWPWSNFCSCKLGCLAV